MTRTRRVAPRASEKGLELVVGSGTSTLRVIVPFASTPRPLGELDALMRTGR